jgi:SAM-dependent methyltransferase
MAELTEDEQLTIATYNKIAAIWASQHHTLGFWAKEMERFQELLPAGKIIDIGSGGARDAIGLIALGYEYVGVDISEKLLAIARKQLPGVRFYKQSVYKLDFPKEKFEGFWCSAVLLHIPKTRVNEALRRIKLVLKPKAVGFISIKDGEGERIETEVWDNGEKHKRLFSYWSKQDFSRVLKNNGYQVVDYHYRADSQRTRWHCFFVKIA